MKGRDSGFPLIKCPHCDHEFMLEDYRYRYSVGDSFECHFCEKKIYIHFLAEKLCVLSTEPFKKDRGVAQSG